MLYEQLNMEYTSKENDNVNIFPCGNSWTVSQLQEMDYDIFKDADYKTLKMVVNWLKSPAHVAEGLNLKVWL